MIRLDEFTKPMLNDFKDESGAIYVGGIVTHSGFVNQNRFFYLPPAMRDSIPTWTDPYEKPLLRQHDMSTTPIGRVVTGFYFDMNRDNVLLNIHSELDGANSYERLVDLSIKYAEMLGPDEIQDFRNALGGIYLVFKVPAKADIDKIIDRRYLTVSVSGDTNAATCSICRANWPVEGYCEHEPGHIYDGKLAFLIAGMKFDWEETSTANLPADAGAQLMHIFRPNELQNGNLREIVMNEKKTQAPVADGVKKTGENVEIKDSTKDVLNSRVTELEDENKELTTKLEALENENATLKDQVTSLTTDLETSNSMTQSLTDELRDILLVKLSDALGSIGKKNDPELVKGKYGERSIDQLRDMISVLTEDTVAISDSEDEAGEEKPDSSKTEDESTNVEDAKKETTTDGEAKTKITDLKKTSVTAEGDTVVEDSKKKAVALSDAHWRRFNDIRRRRGEDAAKAYLEQLAQRLANNGN